MAPIDASAAAPDTALPHALASLIVIARRLGLTVKPADFDLDPAAPPTELSTADVVRRAARRDLICKPGRMSWESLVQHKGRPLIVRFRDGTSMVFLRVEILQGAPYVIIEDPHATRDALLVLDRWRFEDAWTGDVIHVRRRYRVIDETVPFGYELIARLFLQDRPVVIQLVTAAMALSFLALAPIVFLRIATSRITQYRAVDTLYVLCVLMLALIVIETGLAASRRYIAERIATKVDLRLSKLVFNRVLRLPIEHFEMVPAGETIYRISMMARIRNILLTKTVELVLDSGILLFFVPALFLLSPLMTFIIVALFGATVFFTIRMMPRFRRYSAAAESTEAKKGFFLYQTVVGIRTVKSLALDARQRHQFTELAAKATKARLKFGSVETLMLTVITIMQRALLVGTMAGGAFLAIQADQIVSLSTLFAFIMLTQRVIGPLSQVTELIQISDEARLSVDMMDSLVNQPEEPGHAERGSRDPIHGHVVFSNLEFKYRGAATPALRSISFDVPQGMTLGIMGRSGSGKTTITRLLQRLHSDYRGVITLDGRDVRDYDIDHLRSSLGVVLQENFLFSGTIRDNIMAAKREATFDEVVRAARLAGAQEFIDKLPAGYDTMIYEGSPNLSGGQRQRLAIARALITDPKILILDEATSALDAESEAIVNANLKMIAAGRTMLVISHRLASLVSADAIMVLDRGEVHDIGTHYELLERCDIYSGLWHHQNAHAAA